MQAVALVAALLALAWTPLPGFSGLGTELPVWARSVARTKNSAVVAVWHLTHLHDIWLVARLVQNDQEELALSVGKYVLVSWLCVKAWTASFYRKPQTNLYAHLATSVLLFVAAALQFVVTALAASSSFEAIVDGSCAAALLWLATWSGDLGIKILRGALKPSVPVAAAEVAGSRRSKTAGNRRGRRTDLF